MTVKTILPIGAKVRILEEDYFIRGAGLRVGDIAAVHKVASKVDGQTHLVITETGNTVWVWDTHLEEVKELPTRTVFNCNVSSKDYLEVKDFTQELDTIDLRITENSFRATVCLTKEAAIALAESLIKLAEGVNQNE